MNPVTFVDPLGLQVRGGPEAAGQRDPLFRPRVGADDPGVMSESVNGQSVSLSYDADSLVTQAGALVLTRDAATGFLTGTTLGLMTDTWGYNASGEAPDWSSASSRALQVQPVTGDSRRIRRCEGAMIFKVMLEGRNFWSRMGSRRLRKLGFVTTRFVDAADETQAREVAVRSVLAEFGPTAENAPGDLPQVLVTQIMTVAKTPVPAKQVGATWYEEDE